MPPHLPLSDALSDDDRRALLARVRQAIIETVVDNRVAELPSPVGRLAVPAGAFVTLHCFSRLRGCIGRTDASLPLAETVVQCAIGAALHDPRFPPLGRDEIPCLEIEISVLSRVRANRAAGHRTRPARPVDYQSGSARGAPRIAPPAGGCRTPLVCHTFSRGDL